MKTYSRSVFATLLPVLLSLALLGGPARAQEEDSQEAEGSLRGKIFVELGQWVAQASGVQFSPATRIDPQNAFNTTQLVPVHGTSSEVRWRAGYEFGRNFGAIVGTWYAHKETDLDLSIFRPGEFIFGETLAYPLAAGFANDGLADGFRSEAAVDLREVRIDFYREAFRTKRAIGKWFAGIRRVRHERMQTAEYYALVPDLPPIIPPLSQPRPDLVPTPDFATMSSTYEGRGIEGGMEFLLPVFKNKVMVESGFSVAAMRGEVDTDYRSVTHFYLISEPGGGPVIGILEPPYDEFGELELDGNNNLVPVLNRISQDSAGNGFNSQNVPTSGQVIEAYLGLRYKAWRELEIYAGFRNAHYTDVGADVRPKNVVSAVGFNAQDVDRVNTSATYEGFYGGVAYRF